MANIEVTGKNVEEATQKALEQLGLIEDDVDVEILEEGARGFLGLGQALARVRVTARLKPAPEPQPEPQPEPKPEPRPRRRPQPRPRPEPRPEPKPKPKPEPKPEPKPQPPSEPAAKEPAPVVPEQEAPAAEPVPVASPEVVRQAAEISREVLQRILDGIGDRAKAVVKSESDGQVVLDMAGGDTAILIGKHGQTIDALQYLVGIMTNRRLPEKVRIILDAEGYRGRREEALRGQALFLAKKVKETSQEAVLEALRANERRIIHLTLADDPEVYTYSEGEEPERHVVISPRK